MHEHCRRAVAAVSAPAIAATARNQVAAPRCIRWPAQQWRLQGASGGQRTTSAPSSCLQEGFVSPPCIPEAFVQGEALERGKSPTPGYSGRLASRLPPCPRSPDQRHHRDGLRFGIRPTTSSRWTEVRNQHNTASERLSALFLRHVFAVSVARLHWFIGSVHCIH